MRFIALLYVLIFALGAPAFANGDDTAQAQFDQAFALLGLDDADADTPVMEMAAPSTQETRAALAVLHKLTLELHPEAVNLMGLVAQHGLFGQPQSRDVAIARYRLAVATNDPDVKPIAALNLAQLMAEGAGFGDARWAYVEKHARIASSAEALAPAAQTLIGQAMVLGPNSRLDTQTADRHLRAALDHDPNDAAALWLLARGLEQGWYGDVDPEGACRFYERAANGGQIRAFWPTGMCHQSGDAGEKNEELGFGWMKMAAEAGEQNGMVSLAVMYALGQGTEPSEQLAADWYLSAIIKGGPLEAHAMRGLGAIHLFQQIEASNQLFGYALLDLAAQAGDPLAPGIMKNVGDLPGSQMMQVRAEQQRILKKFSDTRQARLTARLGLEGAN